MEQPPPISEPQAPAPAPMSLIARLLNVFATPGEVFETIKLSRPSAANWLVPALVMALIGVVSAVIVYSNPVIIQQMHEQQAGMYDRMVDSGKMSRAQADALIEKLPGPTMTKVMVGFGAVFMSFIGIFGWAFAYWLIGRLVFKTRIAFMKMVEVTGLASAISVLQAVITTLLVVNLHNPLATPSLALLLKDPSPQNKLLGVLSMVNIMTFWVLAVRAIGLARLSGVSFVRAATWVFGVWLLFMGALMAVGIAVMAVFGKSG